MKRSILYTLFILNASLSFATSDNKNTPIQKDGKTDQLSHPSANKKVTENPNTNDYSDNFKSSPSKEEGSKAIKINSNGAKTEKGFRENKIQAAFANISKLIQQAKKYFSSLVENTKSPLIRSLLIIMLGLLMSLTPCLYPMIPITLGVLQATASKSLFTNFLLALCYTLGMAITFATMGLLAATGSAQFGSLLAHPAFVIPFVLFLGYLAGAMIGFYDMYIPRFMQPRAGYSANGSFLSAFMFGIFSGSVASPCLSPGLVLLLSIVTTLNNMVLGFTYLFLFGVGIGIPLLIVGTFSQSLNALPKAGNWMVEVKRLFGFMLISMCFHYLEAIMSWAVLSWLLVATFLIGAIFFIQITKSSHHWLLRAYRYSVAFILAASAFGVIAYRFSIIEERVDTVQFPATWYTHYADARTAAQQKGTYLLVDFSTAGCSACDAIARTILTNPALIDDVPVTPVYINCSYGKDHCENLQDTFNVFGYPTIILLDPATETVIKRWSSELLDYSYQEFIDHVRQLVNNN